MKNFSRVALLVVFALVVGGAIFLATWNIPAPVAAVEKVIPNDQFPH